MAVQLLGIALNSLIAACLFFAAYVYLKTNEGKPNKSVDVVKQTVESSIENKKKQHVQAEPTNSPIIQHKKKHISSNCANCYQGGMLKPCSRCREVFYCGKECQLAHWKRAECGHKLVCRGGPVTVQNNSFEKQTSLKTRGNDGSIDSDFGSTESEREELVNELKELTQQERDMLLSQWDKMTPEQLAAPTSMELEQQLKAHKKEMSCLMYKAAYESMDEKETNRMVIRMRELKVASASRSTCYMFYVIV